MEQVPANPWIHIGECPFCVEGLCRVRACTDASGCHLYALCDECGAAWKEPTTDSPKVFPDLDDPRCPICAQAMYGDHASWARAEDLENTPWSSEAIFDVMPSCESASRSPEAADDVVDISENFPESVDDISYGQDEPKPGC